jgi:hypothetical protein
MFLSVCSGIWYGTKGILTLLFLLIIFCFGYGWLWKRQSDAALYAQRSLLQYGRRYPERDKNFFDYLGDVYGFFFRKRQ